MKISFNLKKKVLGSRFNWWKAFVCNHPRVTRHYESRRPMAHNRKTNNAFPVNFLFLFPLFWGSSSSKNEWYDVLHKTEGKSTKILQSLVGTIFPSVKRSHHHNYTDSIYSIFYVFNFNFHAATTIIKSKILLPSSLYAFFSACISALTPPAFSSSN